MSRKHLGRIEGGFQISVVVKMQIVEAKTNIYIFKFSKIFREQLFTFSSSKPWTYNWEGLTTLLSISLFLIYLFIRLNVSIYILMIYKWSKISAWYASWLNINKMQLWKFIGKNRNTIFLDFALFFSFLDLAVC